MDRARVGTTGLRLGPLTAHHRLRVGRSHQLTGQAFSSRAKMATYSGAVFLLLNFSHF
jgi:hypothetical protein